MRGIILAFVLMLWAAHSEASLLFTPDSFTLTFKATFDDTGTDTFCWQCADADPSNDLQAVLQVFPELSGAWTDFIPYNAGYLNLQSTVTNFLGLEAAFGIAVTLTASNPEHTAMFKGFLPGRLLGVDVGDPTIFPLVLECCDGIVQTAKDGSGVEFRQAFFPPSPFLPEEVGGQHGLELELFFPEQVEVIPEPASLVLLGSGLVATVLKRRRALRRGSRTM